MGNSLSSGDYDHEKNDLVHPLDTSQRKRHLVYGFMKDFLNPPEVVEICLKYVGCIEIISETEYEQAYNDENGIVHQGYLRKESLHLKQLRKRWIVVKEHCLYSFKTFADRHSNEPTEVIDLKSFYKLIYTQLTQGICGFYIVNVSQRSKRHFVCMNGDTRKCLDWMKYVRQQLPIYTTNAKLIENETHIIHIKVHIKASNHKKYSNDKFILCAAYSREEKMQNILDCIRRKYKPLLTAFTNVSFAGKMYKSVDIRQLEYKPLTNYSNGCLKRGLEIDVTFRDLYGIGRSRYTVYDFSEYD